MMPSSQQAARLLHAWEQFDQRNFATELNQAADFCRESTDNQDEEERRELLQGIIEEMERLGPDGFSRETADTGLYRELLTHLSRC